MKISNLLNKEFKVIVIKNATKVRRMVNKGRILTNAM